MSVSNGSADQPAPLALPLIGAVDPATLSPAAQECMLGQLAGLLHDCVQAGASVGFVLPFTRIEARQWWRDAVWPAVCAGERRLLLARWPDQPADRIAGTVQLDLATMADQSHRAEICKLLVHPDMRRRGLARALMQVAEAEAVARDRRLLTLHARSGDAAEWLYRSLGFTAVGTMPDYYRDPTGSRLDGSTIMYKRVGTWPAG